MMLKNESKRDEQLRRAKDIIKKLLKLINDFQIVGVLYDTDALKEAEQFLKELNK